jgi:hypothetical protein
MVPGLSVFYKSNIKQKNEMLYKMHYNIVFFKELFILIKNGCNKYFLKIQWSTKMKFIEQKVLERQKKRREFFFVF